MTTKKQYRKRVRRGIRLLEYYYGKDWYKDISLKNLDMGEECHCILGQLYGNYFDGSFQKGDEVAVDFCDLSPRFGFDISHDWPIVDSYNKLTKAWKKEIKKRRAR